MLRFIILQNGGTLMTFGETLASLRKTKSLSQEQLAEKLNLTRQTISKWELNQSTPDIDYLVQLSDFFDVSTDYLIKGEQANNILNSDNTNFESGITTHIETKSSSVNIYKWCVFFGGVLMIASLIGIGAFIICSALDPWSVSIDDMEFEGVLGYLIGTKTLWFFIILSILFIAGVLISAYGIIREIKKQSDSNLSNNR